MTRSSVTRRLHLQTLESWTAPAFVAARQLPSVPPSPQADGPVDVVAADFNGDGKADAATANKDGNTISVLIGNNNGTFKTPVTYPVGAGPTRIRTLDLNQDGKTDLLTLNAAGKSVSVLLGRGDGTFHPATSYAAGGEPDGIAVGDVDGDAVLDVGVISYSTNAVTLLLGVADGTLTTGVTLAIPLRPNSLTLTDFNNDGLADLATASIDNYGFTEVRLNTTTAVGSPTFGAKINYFTGVPSDFIFAADFTGDGQPDLVAGYGEQGSPGIGLLVGNPDGTFQAPNNFGTAYQGPTDLEAVDVNRDGNVDLVAANGNYGGNSVTVLLGNGAGAFGPVKSYAAGFTPYGLAVADFNGDDIPDVLTADSGIAGKFETVSLLTGNGDGTLRAAPNLFVFGKPAIADFNGDSKPDVATYFYRADPYFTGVGLYLNNGDGTFGDLQYAFPEFRAGGFIPRDLNGDGKVDLAALTADGFSVILGNGDGTFGNRFDAMVANFPESIAVDDLNGDGQLDIAVGNLPGVSVFLGTGTGTFGSATPVNVGGEATSVATGDVNGDGKIDLVAANLNGFSVALNNGSGSFASPVTRAISLEQVLVADVVGDGKAEILATVFIPSTVVIMQFQTGGTFSVLQQVPTDSLPWGLTVADLNSDGKPDLAVANKFDNSLTVHLNTGTGSFAPLTRYFAGTRPDLVDAADFNSDGKMDLVVTSGDSNAATLFESPLPTTTFNVHIVPNQATAGNAFAVTVSAVDAAGRLTEDFLGEVTFRSTDTKAALPGAYTFTAADAGTHTFNVTLKTAGTQFVSVESGAATGSDNVLVVAAAANRLSVTPATQAIAGTPFDVTVSALDTFGNVASTFVGIVHLSADDVRPEVVLPADYAFIAADAGIHTFAAATTLVTAGARTVSVESTTDAFPTATGTVTITAAAAAQLEVTSPGQVTAGVPFDVDVTARDQFGNIAVGFTGSVHLTSSDLLVGPSPDYTFIPGDAGIHSLSVTLKTAGTQSVVVESTGLTSGRRDGIIVLPGAPGQFQIHDGPSNTFRNTKIVPSIRVQVRDAFGNAVGAKVLVKLAFGTNSVGAKLAGTRARTDATGMATFKAVRVNRAAQGFTLVATSGTGTSTASGPFTVYKARKFAVAITGPAEVTAGTVVTITVSALDGKIVDPTYVGTVHFKCTAGLLADLPTDYTFTPTDGGVASFTVTIKKSGKQSITVSDLTKPSVKGRATLSIAPDIVSGFLISGLPTTLTHNVSRAFTVTAVDQFGNRVKDYTGTVTFSNSGGTAVLPAAFTFQAKDKGRHSFVMKFLTTGPGQSLTVADQANPAFSETLTGITVK
jgi:FG-GAP-like repeat